VRFLVRRELSLLLSWRKHRGGLERSDRNLSSMRDGMGGGEPMSRVPHCIDPSQQ